MVNFQISNNNNGNKTSSYYFSAMMVVLFSLIVLLACYTATANPTIVNLETVSTRASLVLVPVAKLDTQSDSNKSSGTTSHRIELRTHLGRQFSLDIETEDDDYMGAEYEEIIHDVSKQKNPHEPHLTVISRKEQAAPIQNCLYHGRVSGDKKSTVSINTCSGSITGMIHLSNGELFSIEPVERVNGSNSARHSQTDAPIRSLSLSSLRELALQGDLVSLADNNSEILLVDVNAETKLVDQKEHRNRNRLNGDDIDALSATNNDDESYRTCASDVEKHHRPPTHVWRKLGYTEDEIDNMIHQHQLDQSSKSSINTLQDGDDDTSSSASIRYVEVVLYHDYARLRRFNTTEGLTQRELIDAARNDGIELFNNIRSYYLNAGFKDYTVKMVLMGHVFFSGGDPYLKYLSRDRKIMVISNRGLLENFNKYRSSYGHTNHDIGVLLSGNSFQANIMGVANVGSLCGGTRWNGNINSITYRNIVKSSVLTAHENGHVLNSQHDAAPGYIMNPYVSSDTSFSPQSLRSINSHLSRTTCTINKPRTETAIDLHHDDDGHDGHDGHNNNAKFARGFGVLSTNHHDVVDNNDVDGYKSVAKTSFIYTDNLHPGDRFDYIDSDLVTDGWFSKAEFSLPSDEAIVSTNIPQTNAIDILTKTKPSLSPMYIALIALGSAGAACGLTTMAILFVLRHLLRDKSIHDFFATKQISKDTQIGSSEPPSQPTSATTTTTNGGGLNEQPLTTLRTNPLDTPQHKPRNFELSPNTPRITPASPSYSETVRMRRTSLPQLSPDLDLNEDDRK